MLNHSVNTQGLIIDDPVNSHINKGSSVNATAGRCGACGAAATRKFCDAACYHHWQRSRPLADRFWAKVNKDGPLPVADPELGPCWLWTGSKGNRFGHGGIYVAHHQSLGAKHPKPSYTHRLAWEFEHGPIPAGLHVLHHCDRPLCVRASHLFLGNQDANMKDAASKGRFGMPRRRSQKVSDEQVTRMFEMRAAGLTCEAIGAEFDVTKAFVSLVMRGLRRTYGAPQYRGSYARRSA